MNAERALVIGILAILFLVVLFVLLGVIDAHAATEYVRSSWSKPPVT